MFNRKFSSNIRKKKRMITSAIILLVVFLSVGYSLFSTNLGILGTLDVSKYDQTLYGVLEKAAKKGTYAKEYTGNHQDSMAGVGTEKIYHWYAPTGTAGNTLANEILDKNNVIFADHCWQMIRTTDTGGVKMVYNGEPENNQCLNTRGNHVGYASRTTQSMSTTYYYGTSYTYDKTNNVFSLDGTITTGTIQLGQYTCKQTTSTGTCATLYLVDTLSSGTTYYVLPLNSNSHYSQFGTLQFNQQYTSPADVGYMYNTRYTYKYKNYSSESMFSNYSLSTTYYYADSYDYNETNANKYTLTNPYQVSSTDDYASLVGKYTFRNTSSAYSSTAIYYIAAVDGSTMYYIPLQSGNNLAYYDHSYTYGDSYTDNGNGTYTINNPTTIIRSDYYNYYNTMKSKYVCKDATNNTCSDVWHATSDLNCAYLYHYKSSSIYKFAKGYTYDTGTGKYTLNSDNLTLWDTITSDSSTSLATHHYTCFDTTGECGTIAYVYYNSSGQLYYINLTDGKSVNDALNEMLSNNNINQTNSTMKTGIDAWYKRYMASYTSKLEDTIFCNDRSIKTLNGWKPDGGSVTSYLEFKNYSSNSDLSCTNTIDKFSLSNSNAQLTYPVGLLTYPETYLLNNNNIRKTGQYYWLVSPYYFYYGSYAYERVVYTTGSSSGYNVNYTYGVRPVVSLTPGTEYTSGSGSMADPYIVDMGLQKPRFTESAINNGTKTVTITYSPKCGTEYTCKYTKNNGSEVTVNAETVDVTFDGAGTITATISDGTETFTKDHTVKFNKLYVKSDGNDTTGYGTIANPYKTIGKAYEMAEDTATIYVMDNITETSTSNFTKEKTITLTSCTKSGSTCPTSSANTVTRGSSLTGSIINSQKGTLTLNTITIDGNNVSASSPMINNKATLNLNSNTILRKANSSDDGGAVYNSGGTININGATITNNTAFRGGGIFAISGTINLITGTFTSNSAPSSTGGAIWTCGEFNMSGGSITTNTAYQGGGINCTYSTANNRACTMSLTGGSITYNNATGTGTASADGGAMLINAGDSVIPQVTIDGTDISHNTASHSSKLAGGGAIYNRGNLTIISGSLTYNEARTGGGAILNANILTINNATISNNTAGYGGGIHNTYGNNIYTSVAKTVGNLTINNITMAGNKAIDSYGQAGYGGAISILGGANLTLKAGNITGNTAKYGGAIGIDWTSESVEYTASGTNYGKININGGTLGNNTVQTNGGGIYINSDSTHQNVVAMTTGSITGNRASNGGGVYISANSTFKLSGGSVSSNTGTTSGGGIYKATGSTYTKSGSPTCSSNGQSGLSSACVWSAN